MSTVVKTTINSNSLAPIIQLPTSLINKEVEVTISECKQSTIDQLFGSASTISLTLDELRNERLHRK